MALPRPATPQTVVPLGSFRRFLERLVEWGPIFCFGWTIDTIMPGHQLNADLESDEVRHCHMKERSPDTERLWRLEPDVLGTGNQSPWTGARGHRSTVTAVGVAANEAVARSRTCLTPLRREEHLDASAV